MRRIMFVGTAALCVVLLALLLSQQVTAHTVPLAAANPAAPAATAVPAATAANAPATASAAAVPTATPGVLPPASGDTRLDLGLLGAGVGLFSAGALAFHASPKRRIRRPNR